MRSKMGEETTAFERITDGARNVAAGDVVRVNAKPQVVGRVLHFTIPQVCLVRAWAVLWLLQMRAPGAWRQAVMELCG